MKLIFEDYDCGTRKLVAECSNEQDALKLMNEHLSKLQFKSCYIRSWQRKGTNHTVFDYGSHTKFFVLQP